MNGWKWRAGALTITVIVGVLLGFLGVGPAVFADGSGAGRQVYLVALLLIYALLGLGLGFVGSSWLWGVLLALPGVLAGVLLGEMQNWVLVFVVLIVAIASAATYAGAWIKTHVP